MTEATDRSEGSRQPAVAYFVPRDRAIGQRDELAREDGASDDEERAPTATAPLGAPGAAHAHDADSGGMPFFPDFALREATAAFAYLMILVLLAALTKPVLEEAADPNASGYVPRPEWYFLFLFQLLKYFPGEWEVVGAFVIPSVVFGLLVALPFIDRRREPRVRAILPGTRPVRLLPRLGAVVALVAVGALTLRGVQSAAPGAAKGSKLTAVQEAGADLYQKMGCATCHTVDGEGGDRGSDLTHFARKSDAEQRVLLHFAGIGPESGSEMPAYQLSPDELRALSEYLMTFE